MIDIDFLWVGEKTKTGDAITCQFTDPSTGREAVLVIDGGFTDDGTRIAEHVRHHYGTTKVDLMVCTHPDDDHIKGLFGALEELDVDRLLVHRPAAYGYTGDNVKSSLVEDLIATARRNGTTVEHQFAGTTYFGGALTVAGPTEPYYRQTLEEQVEYGSPTATLGRIIAKAANTVMEAIRNIGSDPGETLTDDNGGTTPRNNSSIILNLAVDGYRALFTGDAGVPALTQAADFLDLSGRSSPLSFFDIPHHGSRHNLDPETLDRLLGPNSNGVQRGSAFVSVGQEAHDFPRSEVANAIYRRGYPWLATRGTDIRWNRGGTVRPEYSPMEATGWLAE